MPLTQRSSTFYNDERQPNKQINDQLLLYVKKIHAAEYFLKMVLHVLMFYCGAIKQCRTFSERASETDWVRLEISLESADSQNQICVPEKFVFVDFSTHRFRISSRKFYCPTRVSRTSDISAGRLDKQWTDERSRKKYFLCALSMCIFMR